MTKKDRWVTKTMGDQDSGPGGDTEQMAAFPLGSVLLPGQMLDLRVFEPRYRVMLFDLRDRDPGEFIVTMIERGSEVGGGDVRAPFGCVARIMAQGDLPDGTSAVSVIGTERARVVDWLAEDPYPVAEVQRFSEGRAGREPGDPIDPAQLEGLIQRGESVLELAESLGQPPGNHPRGWSSDPEELTWQLALATPLATLDRYRLLAENDPQRRIELLGTMLADVAELLVASLPEDPSPEDS